MTRALIVCALLSGCCAPRAATIDTVSTALQAPDYRDAVDGLLEQLGQELVCALQKIAAGTLEQAASVDQCRQRAAEWLTAHGYEVRR